MAASTHDPQTTAEKLVAWSILSTWVMWLIGGLYLVGPALAWVLFALVAKDKYLAPALPHIQRPRPIGWPIGMWVAGMVAMLIILFIGHINFQIGFTGTLKSSVGWAKGWALLAIFPLAGAALHIRPTVIYRAICKLGAQTLCLLPVFLVAPFIGLPETLWVSPLRVLGGSGDEYFAAVLYTIEPGSGAARWQFFAPWSPAAGMVAIIHFFCAAQERNPKWKIVGVLAALAIVLFSQSRLALVALLMIWPLVWGISKLDRPWTWFACVPILLVGSWIAPAILEFLQWSLGEFSSARVDSSRVRDILGRIALDRWENEAYWFGHGVVERGPHLVEYMPIGSHHSWYGLLFVKGLAGLLALLIPITVSFFVCARAALRARMGRVGLSMILALILYSFGENLEVLSYLIWPGLILMGIALAAFQRAEEENGPRKED